MTITKERIEELRRGAEQEMVHGDYMPNIPERIELCRLALKAQELVDALENIISYEEMTRLADCCVNKSCHINSQSGVCSFQTGINYGNADQAGRAREALAKFRKVTE